MAASSLLAAAESPLMAPEALRGMLELGGEPQRMGSLFDLLGDLMPVGTYGSLRDRGRTPMPST
jgi:hypothetical protein